MSKWHIPWRSLPFKPAGLILNDASLNSTNGNLHYLLSYGYDGNLVFCCSPLISLILVIIIKAFISLHQQTILCWLWGYVIPVLIFCMDTEFVLIGNIFTLYIPSIVSFKFSEIILIIVSGSCVLTMGSTLFQQANTVYNIESKTTTLISKAAYISVH